MLNITILFLNEFKYQIVNFGTKKLPTLQNILEGLYASHVKYINIFKTNYLLLSVTLHSYT